MVEIDACQIISSPFFSLNHLLKLSRLVFEKNLHILYRDTEACKIFTAELFIAYRTSRNLENYLKGNGNKNFYRLI